MRIPVISPILSVALCFVTSVHAQDLERMFQNLPPGRAVIVDGDKISTASPSDAVRIDVAGQPFRSAYACRSSTAQANAWDAQIRWGIAEPIAEGDMVLAIFWARLVEPYADEAASRVEVVVQESKAPYGRSLSCHITLTKSWKRYYIPFVCNRDYIVGGGSFSFRFGDRVISWELGQPLLLKYGSSVKMKDLPDSRKEQEGKK